MSWILLAILSPVILLIAAFCSILGSSAAHNNSVLDLCFSGGTPPPDMPAEYRTYITKEEIVKIGVELNIE